MIRLSCLFLTITILSALSAATAQEVPEFPKPTKEHAWLERFVGEWETEAKGVAGPDVPEVTCQGKMTVRMLGGFWAVCDIETDMMGTRIQAVQTIGYDSETKRYVGTWVDSVMNHLWQYDGSVDETGQVLTLVAEGPNLTTEGKTSKFRDQYEFKSKDEYVVTSSMLAEDGTWITFMTGTGKRKK
jgi:hypothetical protein